MVKCDYYKGTEKVGDDSTKIKCNMMPDGGVVFLTAGEEGKEQVGNHCWSGGEGCPYLAKQDVPAECDVSEECGEQEQEEQLTFEGVEDKTLVTAPAGTEISAAEKTAVQLTHRIAANLQIAAQSIISIAQDLKQMRDDKLFSAMGYDDFGAYCEASFGFKQRQAYNFIKVLDTYNDKLESVQYLGITKLLAMAELDEDDRTELIDSGAAEEMSVRELKDQIEQLNKQCEQLTLDCGNARSAAAEKAAQIEEEKQSTITALQSEIKHLNDVLASAEMKAVKADGEAQRAALAEEKLKKLEAEKQETEQRLKEMESRPVEVAVEKPSAEDIEKIRAEERAKAEKERAAEIEKIRQAAEQKHAAELEKLKAENAALQSSAKAAPAPDDRKARIKFCLEETQRNFNMALEAVGQVEDEEQRNKFRTALSVVAGKMKELADGE